MPGFDFGEQLPKESLTKDDVRRVIYDVMRNFNGGTINGGIISGNTRLTNAQFGLSSVTVEVGENIQNAIDYLDSIEGGLLFLGSGTHVVSTNLIGKSAIQIIGENTSTTILNFNGTSVNFSFVGTNVYTAGTITSITSKINVTGSGTAWLANANTTKQLFLAGQWYKIAAVLTDTTLTLAEAYRGNATLPGASYRIANNIKNITFKNLTIRNSTGTGIVLTDVRNSMFDNTLIEDCNKGIIYTNCSQLNANIAIVQDSTSNGVEMTNCGFGSFNDYESIGSGGHGFVLNNCTFLPFLFSSVDASTTDGWNLTDCNTVALLASSTSNGGIGINLVSGNVEITILTASPIQGNTGDGIKLTASSDRTIINTCDIKDNGGYGVNIAASTCDDTIVLGNSFGGNTLGAVQDLGTSTVLKSNTGMAFRDIKEEVRMKNTSGAGVVAGDILVLKAVAAGDEVTTTITAADPTLLRCGGFMAIETIANNSYGRFLRTGFTALLRVNGVTDIAIGDRLTTFTTAGIARRAATGEAYFATALEAYIVDDSLGVIDAILTEPGSNLV